MKIFGAIILSLVLLLSAYSMFVFAQTTQIGNWNPPTASPPGNNRSGPLALDGLGNLNLPRDLNLRGILKFRINDLDIVPEFYNGTEDSYEWTGWVGYTNTDTCDGNVNASDVCKVDERKACWDLYDAGICIPWCGGRASRNITCVPAVRFVSPKI